MTDDSSKKGEKKNKFRNLQITELFMAKAGWSRCFHGIIEREKDENGVEISVYGKIKVNEAHIMARAENQFILGEKLDDMVLLILDYGLHDDPGKSIEVAGAALYSN